MEKFRFHRKLLLKFLKSRKANLNFESLYIHIPFCRQRCAYCDFYSTANNDELIPLYLKALKKEAEFFLSFGTFSNLSTAYVGGGTPSILSEKQIDFLFNQIISLFSGTFLEITFEANPESLSAKKIRMLKELGVTRVSLGIQSLDNRVLKFLGRIHDAKQAFEIAGAVKNEGLDLNIDLIYGIPSQSYESLKNTLDKVLDLRPHSVSAYALTVKKSKFKKFPLKTDERQLKEYLLISETFKEAGYIHYEVSNWSLPQKECRHNLNYWLRKNYLGIGASAASFASPVRFSSKPSIKDYLKGNFLYSAESLSKKQEELEKVYLLLRTNRGADIRLLKKNALSKLREFEEQGLLTVSNGKVVLTDKGLFVMDSIVTELVA